MLTYDYSHWDYFLGVQPYIDILLVLMLLLLIINLLYKYTTLSNKLLVAIGVLVVATTGYIQIAIMPNNSHPEPILDSNYHKSLVSQIEDRENLKPINELKSNPREIMHSHSPNFEDKDGKQYTCTIDNKRYEDGKYKVDYNCTTVVEKGR